MADDRTMRDEHEIASLLMRWGHARDSDDWETLAGCFHDDATIAISWFSGPAAQFIEGSKAMATKRRPGTHVKHVFAGPVIEVRGDRAFSRCHVTLLARALIDGNEIDFTSIFRFLDQHERRDGVWRIARRTAVYEKDRMDPVDPRGLPESFYADMDLSSFQPETKFLSFRQSRAGTPFIPVATVYSDAETQLMRDGRDWLAGG